MKDFLNSPMEMERLRGKTILIVEDDFSSRLYLNKILEKTGAIILNASDGLQAVNTVAEDHNIDLILMDIQLPLMDGYTALRKIREIKADQIVIAQTAYGLASDTEKLIDSGFNDYVTKPVFSKDLIEKLLKNLK